MSGLIGNWGQVNVFLHNLARGIQSERVLTGLGELIVQRIRQNILQQRLSFEPLTKEYQERKVREGYDPRILIRTEQFVDAIVVKDIVPNGKTFTVVVGVRDETGESGVSLEELAYYIEYGTFKQPGRYPFTLSWEEMQDSVKNAAIEQINVQLEGMLK